MNHTDSDNSPLKTPGAGFNLGREDPANALDELDTQSHASSRDQGSAQPADAATAADDSQHEAHRDEGPNSTADQDGKPAWSEMKTKAGKERKRLPLACIACRRKKIRCSGEKPACKHCTRSRIPCVYKVTTRKAAPRTDYMAMLDKRLKRMEDRVIKTIPKDETRDMTAIGRSVVKPSQQGQPARQAKKRSAGAEFLPSLEIQEHLAEVFFDCVYGQSYLLLHKPSFMRRLKAGTVPPVLILAVCAVSARFSTHPQLNSEPPFLRGENWANPAAAIALSRHDEPNITILTVFLLLGLHEFGTCHGGRSWSFGGQALRMAYALQLHQELESDPLGQTNNNTQLSFTDREIRRRTMWACFLMDRYNSSGSQRPPIGNERFLQIQLPIKEHHFQMEIPGATEDLDGDILNLMPEDSGQLSNAKDNMGVSAYIIRVIVIWGRLVDYLNLGGKKKDPHPLWHPDSGYMRLKQQIEEFSNTLPSFLTFTYENLQIHAAEKIANHSPFLCRLEGALLGDMPKPFLSNAGRAAVEAAHTISVLFDRASAYPLTVPFAGYCAYTASTVHIWGIFSKNAQLEARSKENLRHTYRYLNKMKKYWGMFHYMVESAKDRYRQFADAAIKGSTVAQNGNTLAPMFQYGDWFSKYPHGVSRLHWEDPDTRHKETGEDAVMGQKPDLQSVEDFFASLSPQTQHAVPRRARSRKNSKISDSTSNPGQSPSQRIVSLGDTAGMTGSTFHHSSMLPQNRDISFGNFDFSIPPDQLPQLDRQFVYGSFSDFDPNAFIPPNHPPMPVSGVETPNPSQPIFTGQLDPGAPSGAGEFYQPSAWFLPFNLDPMGMNNSALDPSSDSQPPPSAASIPGTAFGGAANLPMSDYDLGLGRPNMK
ncbi:hypothetical protein N7468_001148 [Penicillium chermesinum]|uniref:Zn(2)-C6 fungal-type domain-containing protein n=1 Tax=Penicillium chermesinum TaxID=63820 RepID=A0A9W9PG65_9EURO|nr:uncharacterized protein N7468_001148 [Penicillium chermesinum]KAJ5246165.1 hypothetical protein N7468_001148 [Penicillium chermesinum]